MLHRIKRWSLTKQLGTGVFFLITLIMTMLLLSTGIQTYSMTLHQVQEGQRSQVDALAAQLNTAHASIMKNTERLASTFQELYSSPLVFDPVQTVRVGQYAAPAVTHQGKPVNLNFDEVDRFARMTGGNATVFIRYQDDFLRVTTSLKNETGQRAIGTLLGKNHPGYKQLISGQSYTGEAHLFGTDYMTKYSPVIGDNGQVQAILYVGLPISDVMKELRENLLSLKLGEQGYLGLAYRTSGQSQGKVIAHHDAQGKSVQEIYHSAPVRQISDLISNDSGAFDLRLQEKDAHIIYHATGNGDWVLFSVSFIDDFTGPAYSLLTRMALGALLASLLLVFALSLFLNQMLKPVKKMRDQMQLIGKGDLTIRFTSTNDRTSRNELDQLKYSLNDMLNRFSSIIAGVRNAGEELAATSEQVASTSNVMQTVVNSSKDETSQVSVAIDQMALSVESVAANAVAVFEDTGITAELSANGQNAMNQMEQVIKDLQFQFNLATDRINQLEQDSEEIGKVVEVISSVAEQTNLLALNAAIEAARAGDQGRGFAVVADEVRTLSQRTQKATQEIQDVVSKLQENSGIATEQMEKGVARVMSCIGQVTEAASILNQIKAAADMVRSRMQHVAQETEEQSAAALQIRDNGVSLTTSATQMADQAEDNASAGRLIAQHATSLRQQVSQFSVPRDMLSGH